MAQIRRKLRNAELGKAAMPLTSKEVLHLLEVAPLSALSVEVEG